MGAFCGRLARRPPAGRRTVECNAWIPAERLGNSIPIIMPAWGLSFSMESADRIRLTQHKLTIHFITHYPFMGPSCITALNVHSVFAGAAASAEPAAWLLLASLADVAARDSVLGSVWASAPPLEPSLEPSLATASIVVGLW